jgi:hypothetical protein
LAFDRDRTTFCREDRAWEIEAMSNVELLAFVVAPLLTLGAGLVVFFLTGWLDRRDERHTPAE